MIWLVVVIMLLLAVPAQSAIYYISPSGSNSNNGLSTAAPFLTFAYAIDPSRAGCGNTLVLVNGTFGDGTSTGKPVVASTSCTPGNELIITAQTQRQAKIVDNGCGIAMNVNNSAYIIVDGIVLASNDNNAAGCTDPGDGTPLSAKTNTNMIFRNLEGMNPNRYANSHVFDIEFSSNVLLEGNECYTFHRHCNLLWQSQQVTVRLAYCNPRTGRISGGYGAANGTGKADACVSMYPCQDCIVENTIAGGNMYLVEMNATYGSNISMSGSKVLGSICYASTYGNCIYPNARTSADLNHTPQNITIENVAIVNYASTGSGIRCSDCVSTTINHVTILSTGTGTAGITADNTSVGATSAQASLTMTNILAAGFSTGKGFIISGYDTWSGDENRAVSNGTNFTPTPPSNWGTTHTDAHGMGACLVWVPSTATGSGQGSDGGDIGANVLYRYVGGSITTIPLWNPITGEFPHGLTDLDGTNAIAGQSAFNVHVSLNVNTNGCDFPAGYGGTAPSGPAEVQTGQGTTSASWLHFVDAGMDSLTVAVTLYHAGGNVGTVTAVTGCGGESIPALPSATIGGGNGTTLYRRLALFGKIGPASGSCTITVTTSGNVDGVVGVSVETDNVSAYNTAAMAAIASSSALNGIPTVTTVTNSDETIVGFTGAKKDVALSAGSGETLELDQAHSSVDLRLAVLSKAGASGGLCNFVMGSVNYWTIGCVSLLPTSPGGGTGATRTLTDYRCYTGYGTEADVEALSAANTACTIAKDGMVRIRVRIVGAVANTAPFTADWYCRLNGASYLRVGNSLGSGALRYFGPGAGTSRVPAANAQTTQKLAASGFNFGYIMRSDSPPLIAALAPTVATELELVGVVSASNGDTINCRVQASDGSQLEAYSVTPTINLRNPNSEAP